ncbi:MAG TPA: acyl-CoA dehydrogenase family protein, partial [Acidimicrobiales bacterium]|nr:acyl-CoA dehydrogenase family protein [Acidimicrobiales bacterium]
MVGPAPLMSWRGEVFSVGLQDDHHYRDPEKWTTQAGSREGAMDEVKAEIRAWLEEHWDPDLTVDVWWHMVARAGWTAPHLPPEQGGRGLSRRAARTVRVEFDEFGALGPPGGLGILMAAPTILNHGTPDQIARLVTPILEGQVNWCQLFSEPSAGSDLAGLTTRAERDGDRWVINGQKVWSSMAMESDYGMLLARTDFSVPKHA